MNTQPATNKFQRFHNLVKSAKDDKLTLAERKKAYREIFSLSAQDAMSPHGDAPSTRLPERWGQRVAEIEKLLKIDTSQPLHLR